MSSMKQVVVLDGGTGTTLSEMGHTFIHEDPLWSAAVIKTQPDALVKLHRDFYLAGSDVVLSASYQSSIDGFQKRFNISEGQAAELIRKSVELVKLAKWEAEKITGRTGFVAASVGPYGATLCNQSEYHGRYADVMTRQELQAWHLPRLKVLVESDPDIVALETIPAVHEAEAFLDNMKHFPTTKAWVTFQCKDCEHTAHGETIQSALRSVAQCDNVIAAGVNCVDPDYVTPLLHSISHLNMNIPIIVKPNAMPFKLGAPSSKKYKISDHVSEWVNSGATWVGGCCHVLPSEIAEIKRTLALDPKVHFIRNGSPLI